MKTKTIVAATMMLTCILAVVLYAQLNSKPSIPKVELEALFTAADKDSDGQISKAEFEAYLLMMRAQKRTATATESVRICPNSGQPCTGSGMCSSGGGQGCGSGGGGCCKDKGNAPATGGGCCKDKGAAKNDADIAQPIAISEN